ncbi:MAG TPA: polysaccharide pyruvyl transferase family protein [Candidatus Coprenecus pullistercoris]|nr:polysaccharide pyruvyl transferase family protein [Candidatus Coprenecus pullistercoris]
MNAYFLCATQSSNLGDLLINKMLIDELCKYGFVFVDCYNIPLEFKKYILENNNAVDVYNAKGFSIKKGNIAKFNFFLKENDIQCFTQSPGPLGKLSRKYSIYFKLISLILKFHKIKYFLIGNCCSRAIALKEKISIDYANAYYLRSKSSQKYLLSYHIKNVNYIPDIAFLYRNKAIISKKNKIAALCFREIKSDYNSFIKWLQQIVSLLKAYDYQIELIYQVATDKDFTYKVHEDISKRFKDISLKNNIIWYDNINYYSGKAMIISNRLHSLLLGAIHNAIPIALCDNSPETLKINDVYNSVFPDKSSYLQISINSYSNLHHIIKNYESMEEYVACIADNNSSLCHNMINEIAHYCSAI